jgi:MoaA/NifB/PqqE/SkfB family radical SAM enzyme
MVVKMSSVILKEQLRNINRILNHRNLIERKRQAYIEHGFIEEVGVVELHPTDKCDLQCIYCTYGKQKTVDTTTDFPFEMLSNVIQLKPKAIVIAGGGEPLFYNYKNKTFEDIIYFFKQSAPEIKLGLITNGTHTPAQTCLKEFEWVRVSLDALDKDNFSILKGGIFEKRLESIINYTLSPIKHIGIGFIFNRFNILQIPQFIKEIVDYSFNSGEYQAAFGLEFLGLGTLPITSQ